MGSDIEFGILVNREECIAIEKAFKYGQKAFSINNSDPFTLSALGVVYLMKREYEKAIVMGKRSVEMAPNGALFHALLGFILSYSEKEDKGITHLKQAIRLDPFPPFHYYASLGRCYLLKGQYDKSLEEYKKALKLSPDSEISQVGITAVYSLLGREEDARREAKKLLELNPGWNVAFIRIAPFKSQEDVKIFIDALLKAGLPERA